VLADERARAADPFGPPVILAPDALAALVDRFVAEGRRVVGPRRHGEVVELGDLRSAGDLAVGLGMELGPAHARVVPRGDDRWFGAPVGPIPAKRYLSPPRRLLWRAVRSADGFTVLEPPPPTERLAFVGLRPCELAAIDRFDQVMEGRPGQADADHRIRRAGAVVVAVACAEPAATCFCASAGTGPGLPGADRVRGGSYDVGLVELVDGEHRFLARAGSPEGADVLAGLASREATPGDLAAADQQAAAAAAAQRRRLPGAPGPAGGRALADALAAVADDPRWGAIGERCLACGSCTQVCPTCFCHTVDDATDLTGSSAERWRRWDSCFTTEFSRLHGGSVRVATSSRYRQWLSHKLGTWWDQFGTSGCVGCGRCIAWCPVGIDLTEEAALLVGAPPAPRRPAPPEPGPSPDPPGGRP